MRKNNITYSERPTHAARAAHARGDAMFRTYDTTAIRPKHSKVPAIIALVLAIAALIAIAVGVSRCVAGPDLLSADETATIVVKEGEGASVIGKSLADAKLLASADEFVNAAREMKADSSLIPGQYEIAGQTPARDIVALLQAGPAATGNSVTIPEGLTRQATAEAVSNATGGRISVESFMDASSDASAWAQEFPFLETAGNNSLEGFLFPKTYTVEESADAGAVVRMMLGQFQTETAGLDWAYPTEAGLNLYEAVNLASIVEKEVAVADERPQVASVFYNRLGSDRPYLESDATTAYEVGHQPSAEEVHADTPYSTYSNPGLPPTPICSPGLEAIKAVCSPAQTSYMYFYTPSNSDGTAGETIFSETYEQHQSAINGN
ncbi:endolytic transglycosylase MltG [Parvibacter caecicola]|uniref:endolytic transglycosylase MltG n=1 Tax=Parvibacter caecicola TaxID=747645 RepID=UPI00273221BB|nr:endolytic transglycosylase MltG [Parvibacter caecicola]